IPQLYPLKLKSNPIRCPRKCRYDVDLPISIHDNFVCDQHLYARITGIILSAADSTGSSPALKTVYRVLETDAGINDLTPYFSRFFYQQIKTNTKRLSLLYSVIRYVCVD